MTAGLFLFIVSVVGGWASLPIFFPLYMTMRRHVDENKYAKLVVNYLHTYFAILLLVTLVGLVYFVLDNAYSGMIIYPAH